MNKHPKIFIIILNYNGKDVIENCLKNVFKVNYPNFEVVVVDNGSLDGSLELIKANFSKVHFIKNDSNLGFSAGNNLGIRFALEKMADFVLLLNNNIEVPHDFLAKLIKISESNDKIGIISPIILQKTTQELLFAGGNIDWFEMKLQNNILNKKSPNVFFETGFTSGCAMLIRKEVFKESGLFDEDFFLYWGDIDFNFRAQKAGFKTIIAPSSIINRFKKNNNQEIDRIYWKLFSGLIFFKKNTTFPMSLWVQGYSSILKLKNYLDNTFKKDKKIELLRKAYKDFDNFSKKNL